MRKNSQQTFELVFFSILVAVMVVLDMTGLAFIVLGFLPTSITTIPVVVITGGIVLGRKYAWALGAIFGILSIVAAFTRPAAIFSFFFQNPFISIMPRVIFGVLVFEIYNFWNNTFVKMRSEIKIFFAAFLSVMAHSIMVLLSVSFFIMIDFMVPSGWGATAGEFLMGLLLLNVLVEIILVTIIAVPVTKAVLSTQSRNDQ